MRLSLWITGFCARRLVGARPEQKEKALSNETNVTVIGNLTADPELRYSQNGLAVVNLTIAQTPRFFDKQSNEWKEGDTLFLRASAWREFAEHIAGSLSKGARVIAQGVLQQRNYEDREGNKRSSIELKVEAIGPDLRYATAEVTRSQRDSGGPRETVPASDDVWNTPSNYNEEAPF